jgi:serine/threonine-protein kinase
VGTLLYMSPEQVRQPEEVDGRADLFSVGVVLLELLTGKLPRRTARGPSIPKGVTPRVAAFLKKMLAADPKKRVASAKDARAMLQTLQAKPARPRRG